MGESVFSKYMTRPAGYLMFFFCGILAGVAVVQVQNSAALAGISSEYFLNQYANLRIDSGKLLSYVGRYRCGQYFLAVCCGVLPVAPAVFAGLVFLLGMAWGTALSISAVRLGLAGILICAAGIFPQFFFYLPAFGWVLLWTMYGGRNRKRYFCLIVAGFFFLLFGIGTEAGVNPLILQQVLSKIS